MNRQAVICGILLLFGAAAFADSLECPPDFTEDSLDDFRDAAVQHIVQGDYAPTKAKIQSCFSTLSKPPKCFDDLSYYLQTRTSGSLQPNERGEGDGSERLTMRSERELPPEFLPSGSSGLFKIPQNIVALAAQKGWKVISYKTRSTGGFDSPANLTLVVIPGRDKDIYVQISPTPNADVAGTRNDPKPIPGHGTISDGQRRATVITVDKTVSPPVGQLRLLSYESGTPSFLGMGGSSEGYRWSNNLTSQSCISCHTAPLRSISPRGYLVTNGDEKRMSPEDERTVREINQMMLVDKLSWGETKTDGRAVRRGPEIDSHPLGWAPDNSPTRKPDFIKRCSESATRTSYRSIGGGDVYSYEQPTGDLSQVNPNKVAVNMNCVQCHNGGIRGPLSEHFSMSEVEFKIVVDRSMPPGANLSGDERLALVNCLKEERNELRQKWSMSGEWMKKAGCQTIEGQAPPAATPTSPHPTPAGVTN